MAELHRSRRYLPWIDIAKALAIFLVVFGHVMREGYGQRIVYLFHVPTFFLLSGATCRVGSDWKRRIKKDFHSIMIPYYIWGLISIFVFVVLGRFAMSALAVESDNSIGGSLFGLLYASPRTRHMRYNLPLWFLPCLFLTKLMYYGLHALFHGHRQRMLLGSVGVAALGFLYTLTGLPSLPFFAEVACKLLFFFVLGNYLMHTPLPKAAAAMPRGKALGIGAGLLAVTAVLALLTPKVNYTSDTFHNIPAFYIGAILGSFGMVLVSMGIRRAPVLEQAGRQSLDIMVMHKFPVVFFQIIPPFKGLLAKPDSITGILFGGILVTLLCIVLCLAVSWFIHRLLPKR